GEIETRMKLIDGAAVCECEARHALAQRDAARGQFLRVFANYVPRRRVTFAVVVDVNAAGVEWDHMSYFVDEDLERVGDVQLSPEGARDLVKRVNLAMRFLDLIVGDERTALACLGQVDRAQLYRRLGRVVGRLMLQSQLRDLLVKTRQVFEKLFDHDGIEMDP